MTLVIACGASGIILLVSDGTTAIADINRADHALTELSHNIARGHASIRAHVTTAGASADAALRQFNASVSRRFAQLQSVNAGIDRSRFWSPRPYGNADVQHMEADRREYATAVATAIAHSDNRTMTLRFIDLRAQKLIQTVEAVIDRVDTARDRVLFTVETMVALWSAAGAWLIAYLIWRPVFTDARPIPRRLET